MGFEPAAMPPETVADLEQLTRRLDEMQAVPSLPLLPGVRFSADQVLHVATGYYHLRKYDKAIQLLN